MRSRDRLTRVAAAPGTWVARCVALCVFPAATARADLFALTTHPQGSTVIAHYSDSGRFIETLPPGVIGLGESADALAGTPGGSLYYTVNTLGMGALVRLDPPYRFSDGRPIPLAGYSIPLELALDPAGRVYATSTAFAGQGQTGVFRYDPSNQSTTLIPARNPSSYVTAVAVAPGGDVFVGRGLSGPHLIERYSGQTGAFVGEIAPAVSGEEIRDLEFGPDGNLYVPTASGVRRYNPQTGTLIDTFIAGGSQDIVLANGLWYVNHGAATGVLRYDPATGAFRDVFITPEQYTTGTRGGLDDIVVTVPEPSAAAALALAASLLTLRRRRVGGTHRGAPPPPGLATHTPAALPFP